MMCENTDHLCRPLGVLLRAGMLLAFAGSTQVCAALDADLVWHDFRHNAAGGNGEDRAYAVALDAQGRIYAAGASNGPSQTLDMVVCRYLSSGQLDPSFGTGGIFAHHNAAGGAGEDVARGIVVNSAGDIYVVGYSKASGARLRDMVVWKLTPGGVLAAFGTGGFVASTLANNDYGRAVALDGTGNVLVCGYLTGPGSQGTDMAVWKYQPNGQPVSGFGVNGVATLHNAAGGNGADEGYALALDPDGNLYVTGRSWSADGTYDMVVWKLDPAGQPDPGFGTQGVAWDPNVVQSGNDEGLGIGIKDTGTIFVAGRSPGTGGDDMVLWKYRPDGILDTGFGTAGVARSNAGAEGSGADWGNAIAVRRDSVYVAGTAWSAGPPGQYDMALWKFDGVLGTSWGAVTYTGQAGDTLNDVGSAVVLGSEGTILIAGSRGANPSAYDLAVWAYEHNDLTVHLGGELLPPEAIADQVAWDRTSFAPGTPATRVFYHAKVYGDQQQGWQGRHFANEAGFVTVTWRDSSSNGIPGGESLVYEILDTPAENPWVTTATYFLDRTNAGVRLDTPYTHTVRNNSAINSSQFYVLNDQVVTQTCPGGHVILQYDSAQGQLVGFEMVYVLTQSDPVASSAAVGRKLPTPEGTDGCRVVLDVNFPESGTPVAWQRATETSDIYPIRPDDNSAHLVIVWPESLVRSGY